MKATSFFFLSISICFVFQSCKKDVEYLDKQVKFYTNHPTHIYTPSQFETVTEQVLLREGYNEGALFETVTEQVLKKDSYTTMKILEEQKINIVTNAAENIITNTSCFDFYPDVEFETKIIPAEYETRSYQKMIQPGTGPISQAVYTTRTYQKLVNPASIESHTNQRQFVILDLVVPDSLSTAAYIADQLAKHNLDHCELGSSYDVIE